MDSIKQDDRKFGVEDRIQSILLGYLNTFDKEGVAAVHIPPQFTKKTDVEEEGKEKGEEKPGTPPQENEVSKEGSGVPTKEIGSENAVDSIALEKPLDELEMKKEKIEGEGADKVIKMEDDDDEIKEEVPFTITSGSTPGEAGSEEKKAPEEAQNEEAILEKIIEYYNTDKNKLGVVLKNTTIATHELHNAFQDFIISVDTIKDSEIQNFKASKGPAIVNNITSVALSLLEPNKAQVGVSFVFFMFKLMLQDIIDFLGVDEMSLPLFSQTFEFKTEHFNPDGRLVTLLGLTLLGLSELGATRENEGTQNNFYREVCHLLVNHFSRESKRNVEGLNTRNVCEELIYYGIAFNFYDYQSFTITRMEDEENKKTTTSNPMEEFFDTLAISINANKSEIPPSKIVEVFKRLTYGMVAETAAAIPRGVHTTLISLSPTDPEYYFAVNELFRFLFTPERDDEILLSTDGVPNGYLEAWVLVLGTLTLKDKDFKGNLISAVLMALTSPKVPFGEFLEKLATTNLKVLEAYKEDVNRVLENVWAIVRETLKEKLKGVKPEYLIALPKSIFEGKDFQNEIEDISLDHKESYFRIHHDNLNDPHTLVETIDRLLGNNSK